jgi:predicted sulfurtransferase
LIINRNLMLIFFVICLFPKILYSQTNAEKIGTIKSMVAKIDNQFNVPTIQVKALKALMESETENIILIDVRDKNERVVSKIPGSISKEQFEKNIENYKNNKVVVYCTIGYRSAQFTVKARE